MITTGGIDRLISKEVNAAAMNGWPGTAGD